MLMHANACCCMLMHVAACCCMLAARALLHLAACCSITITFLLILMTVFCTSLSHSYSYASGPHPAAYLSILLHPPASSNRLKGQDSARGEGSQRGSTCVLRQGPRSLARHLRRGGDQGLLFAFCFPLPACAHLTYLQAAVFALVNAT